MQRDLQKIWPLFRGMNFKTRDCTLKSHQNTVFRRSEGCSLKTFAGGQTSKLPILPTSLAIKFTLGILSAREPRTPIYLISLADLAPKL